MGLGAKKTLKGGPLIVLVGIQTKQPVPQL